MKKIFVILAALQFSLFSKLIVFDAGGVLLNKSNIEALGVVKFKNMLKYFFKRPHKIGDIQQTFYYHLARIEATQEAIKIQNENPVFDDRGIKLPPIMVDWLLGNISAREIRSKLLKLEFEDGEIRRMVLKITKTLFPENLSKILKPNTKMFKLALECKAHGHDVVIFSNLDSQTFNIFVQNNKNLFNCFDKIFVSSDIHLVKPHKEAYQYVLEKMNAKPEDTILIDDQLTNIENCKNYMIGIEHKSFSDTRSQLRKLQLFKI